MIIYYLAVNIKIMQDISIKYRSNYSLIICIIIYTIIYINNIHNILCIFMYCIFNILCFIYSTNVCMY